MLSCVFKIQLGCNKPLVLCPDWGLATVMGVAGVLCLSSAQLLLAHLLQPGVVPDSTGKSRAMSLTSPPVSLCPRLLLQSIPISEGKAVLSSAKPPPPMKMLFAGTVTQLWIWAPWHARDQHTSVNWPLTSLAGRSGTGTASTSTQSKHPSTIPHCQGTALLCRGPAASRSNETSQE